jgi:hypothetical protein
VCLFNITADPCEYNNLVFKFPDVVRVGHRTKRLRERTRAAAFVIYLVRVNLDWMGGADSYARRKIRLIESNAKFRYLKKFTCKGATSCFRVQLIVIVN